jgi:hypothetical protein
MSDKPIAVEAKPEVPVVEEFESCSKMEVQVQYDVVRAALDELRQRLIHYCKGRGISFQTWDERINPKNCSVRDMMVLARTIVRSSD